MVGTGDITHARWRDSLRETLEWDEASGLYRLRSPHGFLEELPEFAHLEHSITPPLFMLQGEISSIYKRGGKVRRVHNLVYFPTLEAAEAFATRLGRIGNLEADGRPIVGLDSHNLLEMVLETAPGAFVVPAHIWTPWFSLFGSKSGFNTMQECFGDLAHEIFALETGLSSDPDMNRMWSALDAYRLVSNSDAHSGENLGREANLFSGTPSYQGIYNALKHPATAGEECTFQGTLEFFPEEGKYHLDGHRACNVVLEPEESRKLGGICPVCGKPLTLGVLYRVQELADRPTPIHQPGNTFSSLVPLPELLGEILGVGAKSKKVGAMYVQALQKFGSELDILQTIPPSELEKFHPALGESLHRMRSGQVTRKGGYDGEYGVVRVFSPEEQRAIRHGSLFAISLPSTSEAKGTARQRQPRKTKATTKTSAGAEGEDSSAPPLLAVLSPSPQGAFPQVKAMPPAPDAGLNTAQAAAVAAGPEPVLVLAGPGSGKTKTLVQRIYALLQAGTPAEAIVALTYSRRAATELQDRLAAALSHVSGAKESLPMADTLHALALRFWNTALRPLPVVLDEPASRALFWQANQEAVEESALPALWQQVTLARERLELPMPGLAHDGLHGMKPPASAPAALLVPTGNEAAYAALLRYTACKRRKNLADYTDLLEHLLEVKAAHLPSTLPPWQAVLADEVQDLSALQLRVVQSLLPASGNGFFGIGDPDQSIYGFRGAYGNAHTFFRSLWPGLHTIALPCNYRSAPVLVRAATASMQGAAACPPMQAANTQAGQIILFSAPSAASEAAWVAEKTSLLLGKGSLTLQGGGKIKHPVLHAGELSPGDIAVLVRTKALLPPLHKALLRAGVNAALPEAAAFWHTPQVALLLSSVGAALGLPQPRIDQPEQAVTENGGPTITPWLLEQPPTALQEANLPGVDALFWESDAFSALCRAWKTHKGWQPLLNWVHLQTELELVSQKAEQVQLMTIHASKGLEFKAVFMPCLEEGLLPFAGTAGLLRRNTPAGNAPLPADQLAEERRLFYVGITRAKSSLFLSHTASRMLYGQTLHLAPSSFLAYLPPETLTRFTLTAKTIQKAQQLSLLSGSLA